MPFQYHNGNPPIAQRMVDGIGFGRIAIITGCASGIGLATTQLFLSHQYQVLGVDISEVDYTMIDSRDQERFHFHRADLTLQGECDEVVRILAAEYGPKIDVLANIASVTDTSEAADACSDTQWNHILAVNLTAPTRMIRAVLPLMRAKNHGAIINVASKNARGEEAAGVAYMASKHGLVGVTKNTAVRFQGEGIRCNILFPGAIESNTAPSSARDSNPHSTTNQASSKTPNLNQRPAVRAVDIANAILFLASDQASMINGVSMPIDKAWSAI